ncbi:MAG TPA: molybdopterin-guanine dinucleotide biosynthesis protein B [Rhizobacter sp.]
MKVVGFSGYSGSGKTTLIEKLLGRLKAAGQRVSVIKHAHHRFDIDHPGKDSYRHREAGAFEVVVASNRRLAKVREYEHEAEVTVHQLLAELVPCDWAIVEGFRHADLLKIEVWRAETGEPAHYPDDPFVIAVATDAPQRLPVPTALPVFHLDDAQAVADFLLSRADRHEYISPFDAPDA